MSFNQSRMEWALSFVIDAYLAIAGKTRADLARRLGVSRSTIKRRMDGASLSVKAGGLDAFVDEVADLVDVTPMDLWAEALNVWRARADWSDERWRLERANQARLAAQMKADGSTGAAWSAPDGSGGRLTPENMEAVYRALNPDDERTHR